MIGLGLKFRVSVSVKSIMADEPIHKLVARVSVGLEQGQL